MLTWNDAFRLFVAVITSLGGGTLLVIALSSWLGRVWASRILEQDRASNARELEDLKQAYSRELETLRLLNEERSRVVEAELDRITYVTKAHFDTEFEALTILWRAFKALQLSLNELRPMFGTAPAQEPEEERLARLFASLSKSMSRCSERYNEALAALENERPFYTTEVWEAAEAARQIAARELHSIQTSKDKFGFQWFIDGSENTEQFGTSMHRLELTIRDRIQRLCIRPQGHA